MSEFDFEPQAQVEEPTPAPPTEDGKPAFFSSTIWGLIIAVAGVLMPEVAPDLPNFVEQAIVIVGAIIAAIGRVKATKSITGILPKLF